MISHFLTIGFPNITHPHINTPSDDGRSKTRQVGLASVCHAATHIRFALPRIFNKLEHNTKMKHWKKGKIRDILDLMGFQCMISVTVIPISNSDSDISCLLYSTGAE